MKVSHYKPGDHVRTLKDFPLYGIKKGEVGTVTDPVIPARLMPKDSVMVRFGRDASCQDGKIQFYSTFNIRECDLVPAEPEETVSKKEELPHIDGFIQVKDAHENEVYINIYQIDSVSVSRVTGAVTVSTQGFSYELGDGYTIEEIMEKIVNERSPW